MTKGKTRLILLIAVVVLAMGGLGLAINAGGSDRLDPPPVQASAAKTELSPQPMRPARSLRRNPRLCLRPHPTPPSNPTWRRCLYLMMRWCRRHRRRKR